MQDMVIGAREEFRESVSEGFHMTRWNREINGVTYSFVRVINGGGHAALDVVRFVAGDGGVPVHTFAGKVRELPGLMAFSGQLGKLLSF
jgi:hypothetical protein